ncbi:calcium-activated chloride channel regulator 3A-1-like [Haliotis rufescens]|uniref:calcium-activated chloride channel regulator 3A-1-like n=1 Tax=Haliotis rufescens TaxID=6454 RepID=UPI00201EFEB2|nr:calcium-activated chloride channel regulator 3A-1-like [Haliotis rufescens]
MGVMSSAAVLIALLFLQLSATGSTLLNIHNNKYDNLVVAIHDSVPENLTLISEMKSIISDASSALYKATRKRSYIGSVTFLIPGTWSKQPAWANAKDETFEEADIRIDQASPVYGNNPYTEQPAGCGDPGEYIHLTPEYILNPHYRLTNWGEGGRTLVHEFAHLRYGVFDEYGLNTAEFPNFYLDDDTLMPTGCTNSIKGHPQGNCTVDPATHLPGSDCYFLTDIDGNSARASIMNDLFVKSVTTFCESNSNDPDYLHNDLAPNQHNKMCRGRGTWDIILENPDFAGGANPPVNRTEAEIRPTFNVLFNDKTTTHIGGKVCGRPVVLVLDLSGSMESNNRYFKQSQTADKLIRDILPVGTKVGMVTFSSIASTRIPLTSLSTTSDRDRVSQLLPKLQDYGGGTGIGNGLLHAKLMLQGIGALKEGRIVLITDGEENVSPRVADVKGELIQAGVRVHAVAYSSAAAVAIGKLANETGGQYAYYSEGATSTVLDSVIETLMKDISICNHRVRIEIMRVAKPLIPTTPVEDVITMDATVGSDTMFVFTLPQGASVTVTLTSPTGIKYTSASPEYSLDSKLNIVRFNFQKAQTGVWHYSLLSPTPGTVTLVVKALPGDHTQPYEITSWLSSTGADLSGPNPTKPVVYVSVRKGYSPVVDADVTVTVERPSGPPATLKPMDKGTLPDNKADDGVYSVYFTQFTGNERYSLDVDVRTIAHKTRYFLQGGPAFGRANSRYPNTTAPFKTVEADNFTRTTSPGAMDVTGFVPGKDVYAPGIVTDLKVVAFNANIGTVNLTWTAPGDDLDVGTASRYEIRIAETASELNAEFSSCQKVSGPVAPKPANSREKMTIKTPVGWTTVCFALVTFDEVNHASDKSNIAVATFKEVTMNGLVTAETTRPTRLKTGQSVTARPMTTTAPSAGMIGAIVGGMLGGVAIAAAAAVVIAKMFISKKVLHRPSDPLDAPMTEPAVPNESVFLQMKY